MNISTFYGLNVGMTALDTAQQVEDVISNNIANANTPGYAQETAKLSETGPFPTVPSQNAPALAGQMGEGSQVSSVQRDTSAFLDQQDRANQGTYQMYQTHAQNLTMVEGILNEPSSQSIQNAVDQFFSSWQTLSTDPSNTAARQAVISQAQTLGQTFQTVSSELETLQSNLVGVVTDGIGQLNTDAKQVASLNTQIIAIQGDGQSANQLLDQRSQLLDNMSKLANISYTEQSNGAVYIQLSSSSLVDGSGAHLYPPGSSTTFNTQTNAPTITNPATLLTDLAGITSGSIAGNLSSISDTTSLLGSFDNYLQSFAGQVNDIQTTGMPLSGQTAPPPIFDVENDQGAPSHVYLAVDPNLTAANVAAATSANTPGDNSNALKMVNLQNDATAYNGGTFDQGIAALVSGIGVETAAVNNSEATANALAQQSSNMRQSISGVDINEQAALMVQYQNSYAAAAKFVSVFQQMMSDLMNIVP